MRGSEIDITCLDLIKLEKPKKRYDDMIISVTEKGKLCLNGKLRQEMQKRGGYSKVSIVVTQDSKIIGIKQDENSDFQFPKSGIVQHLQILCMLNKQGYNVPAKYIVEWNERGSMWVGVLQEVAEAPQIKRKQRSEKKYIRV